MGNTQSAESPRRPNKLSKPKTYSTLLSNPGELSLQSLPPSNQQLIDGADPVVMGAGGEGRSKPKAKKNPRYPLLADSFQGRQPKQAAARADNGLQYEIGGGQEERPL